MTDLDRQACALTYVKPHANMTEKKANSRLVTVNKFGSYCRRKDCSLA